MQTKHAAIPLSRQAGDFLRRQLAESGYTQERFADEFGVSERQVRRWESGGINSLDTLSQLLDFFGRDIGDIFSYGEDIPGLFYFSGEDSVVTGRPDVRAVRDADRTFYVLAGRDLRWYNIPERQRAKAGR